MSDKHTDEAKGRVKKAAGELTGDEKLKNEGTVDKASAKSKDMMDKAKQGIDKAKNKLTGKE